MQLLIEMAYLYGGVDVTGLGDLQRVRAEVFCTLDELSQAGVGGEERSRVAVLHWKHDIHTPLCNMHLTGNKATGSKGTLYVTDIINRYS